jgi:hypothetical protein
LWHRPIAESHRLPHEIAQPTNIGLGTAKMKGQKLSDRLRRFVHAFQTTVDDMRNQVKVR